MAAFLRSGHSGHSVLPGIGFWLKRLFFSKKIPKLEILNNNDTTMEDILRTKHPYEAPEVEIANVIAQKGFLVVSNYDGAETD